MSINKDLFLDAGVPFPCFTSTSDCIVVREILVDVLQSTLCALNGVFDLVDDCTLRRLIFLLSVCIGRAVSLQE